MNNAERLILFKDKLPFHEANQILCPVFSSSINFYKIKNLISTERFGKQDETVKQKIQSLLTENKRLLEILEEANAQNKKITISSEVHITLSDEL